MTRKILFVIVSGILIMSFGFSACSGGKTPTQTTLTVTSPTSSPTKSSSTPEASAPLDNKSWWETKWGAPSYGGQINYRSAAVDIVTDPQSPTSTQFGGWMESLFSPSLTLDRSEFAFKTTFVPVKYQAGWLAKSWQQKDPTTIIVNLNQGIKWQNKFPMNGRDFTAQDVQYSYDRILGLNEFQGKPNPFYSSLMSDIASVTAIDKTTIEFKLKYPSAMAIYQITGPYMIPGFVGPEWVHLSDEQRNDWKNVIGTGPYILTDFTANVSMTLTKNPDYWGYDPRNPKNKLPYADSIKITAIPEISDAIGALRNGKIDIIADENSHLSIPEAQAVGRTNPQIVQVWWPEKAPGVIFKYNAKPYDDIKVRQALQMAIDSRTIVNSLYRSMISTSPTGLCSPLAGSEWVDSYSKWPKTLQDEYSYNVDKAKQLLKDAGYSTGFDTEIMAAEGEDTELLETIRNEYKDIGVNMKIMSQDMTTYRKNVSSGNYKQMVFGSANGSLDPPSQAVATFWSKNPERSGLVSDPTYDAMVDQFLAASTDSEAQKIYKQIEQYALERHFSATVCPTLSVMLHQSWLKGWAGEYFSGINAWRYLSAMWIDPSLK
jgi:peptide/nickel transport system substrate-binding protein